MSRIRLLVCRVEDDNPDAMTQLASFDMPEIDLDALAPGTALDALEASTYEVGTEALRRVLEARFEEADRKLAEQYRQSFSPSKPQTRWRYPLSDQSQRPSKP